MKWAAFFFFFFFSLLQMCKQTFASVFSDWFPGGGNKSTTLSADIRNQLSEEALKDPLVALSLELLDQNEWFREGDLEILLMTPEQFQRLPDGVLLYDIFDRPRVKGQGNIALDTRDGMIAYGVKKNVVDRFIGNAQQKFPLLEDDGNPYRPPREFLE